MSGAGRRVKPSRCGEADRQGSLAEFASAIREGRERETSGRDNIRSLALVVQRSIRRTRAPVHDRQSTLTHAYFSTRRARAPAQEA